MSDDQVVDSFLAHLRQHGFPELELESRPDQVNRVTPDIDAIAGRFAIEHTSLDTVPNQRRNDDWFGQVIQGLEDEFQGKLRYRLKVLFEYDAVVRGIDWKGVRSAIRNWVECKSLGLADGSYRVENAVGVPFAFRVQKQTDRPAGLLFFRETPADDEFVERLGNLLARKISKLVKYSDRYETILLVESSDIALMSESIFRETVTSLFPEGAPTGLSQIWYADTSIPSELLFEQVLGRPATA